MVEGVVKWFHLEKGYGFIAGDNGTTVFVHYSNILMQGFKVLEEGQRVSYQEEPHLKGTMAINVMIIE